MGVVEQLLQALVVDGRSGWPSRHPAMTRRRRLPPWSRRSPGLLAVAGDGNDGGPLCLDTRGGGSPEGWPIVLWDHDWEQVTATPDSSAEPMVACVTHLLQGGRAADLAAIDP